MEVSPLVARDGELARLTAALERCRSGSGGLVLVSGEAGIGKSRLVAEALAGWGGCRLAATAVAGSRPYAPLLALLRAFRQGASDEEPTLEHENRPAALLDGLRAAAERTPTVVVLEDLQLADAATIGLLPAAAEIVADEPLLVIGVYRSDDLPRSHPLRGMRSELRRIGRLVDIPLKPLTAEQAGELLASRLGAPPSPKLVAAVHGRAEGMPFFLEELAAALRDCGALVDRPGSVDLRRDAVLPVPESVVDAVLARTAGLLREHRDAVEYAATLGVQVDLAALADLVGPAEVDALIEAGLLLEVDAGTAVFRHALVRMALHRTIPWARRRSCHSRVAGLLAGRGAAPALVAEHWIAAQAPERARPLLLAAAREHSDAHAYRDAASLAARALALWPEDKNEADRLTFLGQFAEWTESGGDLTAATRIWADLARRHAARGDPARSAAAHRRAANAAELVGDLACTAAERLGAADAYTAAGALAEAAVERLALAGQFKAAGRLTSALEQVVAATDAATEAGRRDLSGHALALQGAVRAALGQGRRGVELARAGLDLALSEQLAETAGEACYELGEALEYAADYAAAVDAYESAFELCRSHGLGELAKVCYVCMSPAARLMGDWERTLGICAEILADEHATVLTRRVAEEESGLILALRGDSRRARGPLRRAVEFGQANGVFGVEIGARWGLALVAELEQDEVLAGSAVAALLDCCRAVEECHYVLPVLRWAASFLSERRDADGVAACSRVVATLASRNGSPKVISALAHVSAELAMTDGDDAQAGASFTRSMELLSGITAPYERAHTQWRWSQTSTAAENREEAVATLSSAYRTARRLGARPLAQRCATALAATGERVDPRLGRSAARAAEPAALTRREQEVLRHLAAGKTNPQIAAELFLSTRTVDMHVRNLLLKLDCSSRALAVRRATSLGLLPVGG